MKKLLLSLFIAIFGLAEVSAQCTPDPSIPGLIVPPAGSRFDTVNGKPFVVLPYGYVNQNYHEVLYFKIPTDTTAFGLTATINYAKLDSVLNTPAGMALTCTPSDCKFPGGTSGCASMDGIPQQVDSVEIKIAIEYNVTISGLPTPIKDTLGGYYFVVKGGQVSLEENKIENQKPTLYPNPANSKVFIDYNVQYSGEAELTLTNLVGRVVSRKAIDLNSGNNTFSMDVSHLNSGIYMYTIREEGKTFTGRFSISH